MRENKNCPSGAGTPERQRKIAATQKPTTSNSHCNTDGGQISRFLLHGRRNAIGLKQLQSWTGIDGRTIRLRIEKERRDGCPILADNQNGYYLAETDLEKRMFVASMRHRAREILKTADCIERAGLIKG